MIECENKKTIMNANIHIAYANNLFSDNCIFKHYII